MGALNASFFFIFSYRVKTRVTTVSLPYSLQLCDKFQFIGLRINAIDDRYRSVRSKINKMICGVLVWSLNVMKGH